MASAPVASIRMAMPLSVAALGVIVWLLWSNEGKRPGVTLENHAFSNMSYDAYAWWTTQRHGGTCRHFPSEMGPNILNRPIQNEDGAFSTNQEASPYG